VRANLDWMLRMPRSSAASRQQPIWNSSSRSWWGIEPWTATPQAAHPSIPRG